MGQQGSLPDLAFDHVGILVGDLGGGSAMLVGLFGRVQWTRQFDDSQLGVSVRFARDPSGMVYELITPLGESSPVGRVLKSRVNLLNQIAYRTRNLEANIKWLRENGSVPIGTPVSALAFGGARVQFMMTPLGFLLELIETDRAIHEFIDDNDCARSL